MNYLKIENNPTKEWILFIHGLGGSINTWKKQIKDFSENYNLLLIDLDGHGQTKPKMSKEYKPLENARKIYEIMKKENISKVHIVSLSLGTLVALEFVRVYYKHTLSMTIAGCIANLDKKRNCIVYMVEKLKSILPSTFLYKVFANILLPKKNHKLSREIFVRESQKMDNKAFFEWVKSIYDSKKYLDKELNIINKYNIPTLFVMGNEDYIFLSCVKKLKTKVTDFKLKTIEKCGHVCSIEKGEIFNTITKNFLDTIKKEKVYIQIPLKI